MSIGILDEGNYLANHYLERHYSRNPFYMGGMYG
jgi:hypothetical protein